VFQLLKDNSRWDLPDDDVTRYIARSYDYIIDLLRSMDRAEPFRLDPSGDEALRMAKRVRRRILREAGEDRLHAEADKYFGMPPTTLLYSTSLAQPLYVPIRSASN
jgi:hypothetical protein